jgi:hypothetical protein
MPQYSRCSHPRALGSVVLFTVLVSPGRNLYTPQQDVEIGQQVSKDAEQKLVMLNNRRVDDYLDRLGKKLAAVAPGEKFPYQFKSVNDSSINAFALPGGFLYVNRGTIEAADSEAQLAGVIGHEIAHVALRHGTNQATKAQAAQMPLAVLGAILGNNSVAGLLAQIGSEFAINSVLLKYSRDAERQSDLMGTQMLYDSNYDPYAMATFFEKLESGGRGTDFFSSHPNPENRMQGIKVEIGKLGAVKRNIITDSSELRSIQKYLKSLPPAPKAAESHNQPSDSSGQRGRPERPSSRLQSFNGENISFSHPENWNVYETDQGLTVAPEGGGNASGLAFGVIMSIYNPQSGKVSNMGVKEATDRLIASLQNSNSSMRLVKDQGTIRVAGKTALSKMLANDSPAGGREKDWLVTILIPDGLLYFVFVAPEGDFPDYQRAFQQILSSVKLSD